MIKVSLFLLALVPTMTLASNDQLSAIGFYHENGTYEPGYVNYRFNKNDTNTNSSPLLRGFYTDGGIFEPAYVNYRFGPDSSVKKCASGDSAETLDKRVC
jgi:hypothetical protein